MKWFPQDDAIVDQGLRSGLNSVQIAKLLSDKLGRTVTNRAVQERLRTRGIRGEYVREMAARERAGAKMPLPPPPPMRRRYQGTRPAVPPTQPTPPDEDDLDEEDDHVHELGSRTFCDNKLREGSDGPALAAMPAEPSPVSGAPYIPQPPRGPMGQPPPEPGHYIPEGHDLAGVSTLTDDQGALKEQWTKTRVAGAEEPPTPIPESFLLKSASVMRRADGSTVIEWARYTQDAVEQWEAIKQAVSEHVTEYVRPAPPVEGPPATESDLLVVYPLGDPHIGMLAWAEEVGESFDLKKAEHELIECLRQLIARSPASEEAIVCNLGDFWHAQDDNQRTPKSGHKLDVDGRHGKVARVGLRILRSIVDMALTKHRRVRVRSIPGNHDPNSAFWLPEYLGAVYMEEPRVTIEDGFNPYQYDAFGRVLLGWAHGDGAKLDKLAEVMAADVPAKWGASTFRYWNTGHVHHWSQKELGGCVVDTHRTLAGRDAWTHHSGYRSGRALKAICYHRDYGIDSTVIVGIERVRAAMGAQ